jgi:hypothetical protein
MKINNMKLLRGKSSTFWITSLILLAVTVFFCPSRAMAQGEWTTNSTDINNTNTGNVGIGTNSPGRRLTVFDNAAAQLLLDGWGPINGSRTGDGQLLIGSTTAYQGRFHYDSSAGNLYIENSYNNAAGNIFFRTKTAGTPVNALTILGSGKVGIGMTNPLNLFHVLGSTHATIQFEPVNGNNYSYINLGNGSTYGWQIGKDIDAGSLGGANGFYIYEFTAGQQATRFAINKGGNVGIGTTSPSYKLDVSGQINASSGLCIAGDCKTSWSQVGGGGASQWVTAGSNIYYETGNVGIGTYPLTKFFVKTASTYDSLTIEESAGNRQLRFIAPNATSGVSHFRNTHTSAGFVWENNPLGDGSTFIERMRIDVSGNVGIGTTTPQELLEVSHATDPTIRITRNDTIVDAGNIIGEIEFNSTDGSAGSAGVVANIEAVAIDGDKTDLSFKVGHSTGSGSPTLVEGIRIQNTTGNVGIGTASPSSLLQLNGTSSYNLSFQNSGTTKTLLGQAFSANDLITGSSAGDFNVRSQGSNILFSTDSGVSSQLYLKNGGNVGIGTTSPAQKLEVAGTVKITGGSLFLDNDQVIRAGGGNQALLYRSSSNGIYLGSGDASDFLSLNAGGNEKVRIDTTGKVGIGTTAPTKELHVVGDATVSGTIEGGSIVAKYQDVAEWVPARQQLAAGTVVILDPDQSNQVMASTSSYDTRVAGVISAQPGVLLGEGGDGKVKVATTGRVKVKVDATRAPIKIGDLLVTSDQEGVAMKSEPLDIAGAKLHRPGTLIGKALEPLEKGVGEILVLLSLQ